MFIINFIKNIIKLFFLRLKWRKVRFFLVGTPLHGNIGDSAIVLAEIEFLKSCGLKENEIVEIPNIGMKHVSRMIKYAIRKNQVIGLHGGGNLGDEYWHEELLRQSFITTFKDNQILLFPQTLFFSFSNANTPKISMTRDKYETHKHLVLFAREKTSYQNMSHIFSHTEIHLVPDIVLSWGPDLKEVNHIRRNGVLLCLRRDVEKQISDQMINIVVNKIRERGICDIRYTDTFIDSGISQVNRCKSVLEKLREFASARLIITDRLHGMIFSALSETPCIAFGNYNHKIIDSYDWISGLPYIKFANNLENIDIYLDELMKLNVCKYDNTVLQSYFAPLKECILDMLEKCKK